MIHFSLFFLSFLHFPLGEIHLRGWSGNIGDGPIKVGTFSFGKLMLLAISKNPRDKPFTDSMIWYVNDNHLLEGNVYIGDQPVCDDGWGSEEAKVACRYEIQHFMFWKLLISVGLAESETQWFQDVGVLQWLRWEIVSIWKCWAWWGVLEVLVFASKKCHQQIPCLGN